MDNLKKGTYTVDINVFWTDQDIRDYTFRIYAPLEIDIKEVSQPTFLNFDKNDFVLNQKAIQLQQLGSFKNPQNQNLKSELIQLLENP